MESKRVFYVKVIDLRHMPQSQKYTVPVLADTLEEAEEKALQWPYVSDVPGAYEYYRIDR
jgi:hypothetical protein